MEDAIGRFQRVLDENNLTAQLARPAVRVLEDGRVVIDQPLLAVAFTDPEKEAQVEPSTEAVASETPADAV